jgi:nitrous oxidase accessory protein NosD
MTGLLLEFTMADGSVFTHTAYRPTVVGHAEGEGILRMADGDFVGLPDSQMSRPHVIFAPAGEHGAWVVNDAGSFTGTRVVIAAGVGAGELLTTTLPVVSGMQLRIGSTHLQAVLR